MDLRQLIDVLRQDHGVLFIWLVVINALAFLAFGADKALAKAKAENPSVRRVPEKTLFLLALLGGGVGAWLGMKVFHHKTLHASFRIGIPLITLAWLALLAWLLLGRG